MTCMLFYLKLYHFPLLLKLFIEIECDPNRGPGWPSVSTHPHVQGTPTIQGPENKNKWPDSKMSKGTEKIFSQDGI